ncbi:MAG: DUF3014 domain-containing protein [Acidobacteriota bacterium]
MDELDDFELEDPPEFELGNPPDEPPPPAQPTRPIGLWIIVGLFVAAAGAAIYVALGMRPRPTPAATSAPTAAAKEAPRALGGEAEPITIPPLDASDALVRTLVRALSESPAVAAWLTTDGLIRNFTVVVTNIADGATPAKQLKALRPSSGFRVVERSGNLYLDPRTYDRYTVIADAIASIDPAGAARLYATLKPRIEEAHRELGSPDQSFDRTVERAIVALLDTPILDGPVRLVPKGIGYAFADERVEHLTGAQRLLLRTGPRNTRIIKGRLRDIGIALGIAPGQLPVR